MHADAVASASAADGSAAMAPLRGCRIFLRDAEEVTGIRLHPKYTMCGWPHHQHSMEVYLERAARTAGWHWPNESTADLTLFVGHHFAEFCHAASNTLRDNLMGHQGTASCKSV